MEHIIVLFLRKRRFYMKITWFIGIIFMSASMFCYAENELQQLYGLREKAFLQNIIQQTERENGTALSDLEKVKMLGIAYHNLAILKEKGASEKAVIYLNKALVLAPDDIEVQAYLGSALTMSARDSWNVFIKVGRVKEGMAMMNEAVSKEPESVVIRMVRANNSLNLPDFFRQKEVAKEDFRYLEKLIMESRVDMPPDIKGEIFYKLGMIDKHEGNVLLANEYFKKAINFSPASEWGRKSEGALRP